LQGIFDCKDFYQFFDSLANPAAQLAGFPLRSIKLRGRHSLCSSTKHHNKEEAIVPEKTLIYGKDT